jgi:hypothetical protein
MKTKCKVRDNRFVDPCETLSQTIDNNIPGFSKATGVFIQHLTNMKTFKPSRTYVGLKSKNFKNGLLFNFCPFCGEDISDPFMKDDEDPKS